MDHNTATVSAIDVFNWIRAPFFILCALFFLYDWFKRRCWLPAYVHVLAVITFIGTWIAFYAIGQPQNAFIYPAISLFFAAVVYTVFILYGGADAAWNYREQQKEKAIENAGVPLAVLRQKARDAAKKRYADRLRLGWGTILPVGAAFADCTVYVFLVDGSLPLWGAIATGILLWVGAVAFFLFTQTYSPAGITWRYIAIFADWFVAGDQVNAHARIKPLGN